MCWQKQMCWNSCDCFEVENNVCVCPFYLSVTFNLLNGCREFVGNWLQCYCQNWFLFFVVCACKQETFFLQTDLYCKCQRPCRFFSTGLSRMITGGSKHLSLSCRSKNLIRFKGSDVIMGSNGKTQKIQTAQHGDAVCFVFKNVVFFFKNSRKLNKCV